MNDDIVEQYPYNVIFQEEMDSLPLVSDLIGLSKFKSQQSRIVSVFDKSVIVKDRLEEIKILKRGPHIFIIYIILAIAIIIMPIFIYSYRPFQAVEFLFLIFTLLTAAFFVLKSFEKGTIIKVLEDRIIVNEIHEYVKSSIKDILLIHRPKGASGERAYIVFISNDNTYFRYDFTEMSEVKAIQAFRQWIREK